MKASENIGHPISLKDAHIEALKKNYVVTDAVEMTSTDEIASANPVVDIQPEQEVENESVMNAEEVQSASTEEEISPLDKSIVNANTMDLAPIIDEAQKVAASDGVATTPDVGGVMDIPIENPEVQENNPLEFEQPVIGEAPQESSVMPTESTNISAQQPEEQSYDQAILDQNNVQTAPVQSTQNFGGLDELNRLQTEFNNKYNELVEIGKKYNETMAATYAIISQASENYNNVVSNQSTAVQYDNQPSDQVIQDIQPAATTMPTADIVQFPEANQEISQNQGPVLEKVA